MPPFCWATGGRAADLRSCSGMERRGERSARTLCVLYGLRLLEMAAFERF